MQVHEFWEKNILAKKNQQILDNYIPSRLKMGKYCKNQCVVCISNFFPKKNKYPYTFLKIQIHYVSKVARRLML